MVLIAASYVSLYKLFFLILCNCSDETERSRNRILEITHFLEYHRENSTVSKILGQQALQMDELTEALGDADEGTVNPEKD